MSNIVIMVAELAGTVEISCRKKTVLSAMATMLDSLPVDVIVVRNIACLSCLIPFSTAFHVPKCWFPFCAWPFSCLQIKSKLI